VILCSQCHSHVLFSKKRKEIEKEKKEEEEKKKNKDIKKL